MKLILDNGKTIELKETESSKITSNGEVTEHITYEPVIKDYDDGYTVTRLLYIGNTKKEIRKSIGAVK